MLWVCLFSSALNNLFHLTDGYSPQDKMIAEFTPMTLFNGLHNNS